jgi:hypothetical protein
MKSALAKSVRRLFDQRLRKELPFFMPDSVAVVPNGWRAFCWKPRPDLNCYLILAIDMMHDRFTIECAWSRTGLFPAYIGLQYPKSWPDMGISQDEAQGGQFRFRLGHLIQPNDLWWWIVPEGEHHRKMDEFADAVIAQDEAGVRNSLERVGRTHEALANVQPMVDNAVKMIVEYAIPYFRRL